jgi:hypothetical protein
MTGTVSIFEHVGFLVILLYESLFPHGCRHTAAIVDRVIKSRRWRWIGHVDEK